MRTILFLLLFLPFIGKAQSPSPAINPGFYSFGAPNFSGKKGAAKLENQLREETKLYDFQAGQVIADIGCFNGWYSGLISLDNDSLHIYLEDVPDYGGYANGMAAIDSILGQYERYRGKAITNQFTRVTGTDSSTKLPEGAFDKILLIRTFHHIEKVDAMLRDLAGKLKPEGKIYVGGPVYKKIDGGVKFHPGLKYQYDAEGMKAAFERNGLRFIEELPFRKGKRHQRMLVFGKG